MVLIGLMSTMVNDYPTERVTIDWVNHYLPIALVFDVFDPPLRI
jgi:hypothetical protein